MISISVANDSNWMEGEPHESIKNKYSGGWILGFLNEVGGAEQLFMDGDGLYMDGRTLYIVQNFQDKIAVVQLSGDLSGGEFIRNISGEGEFNPLDIPTSVIGFGNSLYAINTNFFELISRDPA